jgi:dGTPase
MAIALAHDLGHTPFRPRGPGRAERMHGGARRLRAQPAKPARGGRAGGALSRFDGLNLCFETREGILKHCSRATPSARAAEPGGVARRFLDRTPAQPGGAAVQPGRRDRLQRARHRRRRALGPDHAGAGARRCRCSARTARERCRSTRSCRAPAAVRSDPPHAERAGLRRDRRHRAALGAARRPARTRRAARPPLVPSARHARAVARAEAFLFHNLYRHPRVMETTGQAQEVVRELFARYLAQPARCRRLRGARRRAARAWPTTSPA